MIVSSVLSLVFCLLVLFLWLCYSCGRLWCIVWGKLRCVFLWVLLML